QQLEDHCQHRVEMSGPEDSFEFTRPLCLGHAVAVTVGIEIRRRRHQHEIGAFGLQQSQVLIERSRIRREILWIIELRRVRAKGTERAMVLGAAAPHQRQMSVMKSPHRGNDPKSDAVTSLPATLIPPRGQISVGLHEYVSSGPGNCCALTSASYRSSAC